MKNLISPKIFWVFLQLVIFQIGNEATATTSDLQKYQAGIVSVMSGYSEIDTGIKLRDRYSVKNREYVRQYLAIELGKLGIAPEIHQYKETGKNVYGILPATDSTLKTVIVGAHFDSVQNGPGANDNATGVAMIMGLVPYLKTLPVRKINVIFAFFDEEETGMQGSRAFAAWIKNSKYLIHSVHTVDQMGWDQDQDRGIELELPTQNLAALYRSVHDTNHYTFPLWITKETASDHSSFRALGFPAVGLTEEYNHGDTTPFYHKPSDVFATVNFEFLESSTLFFTQVISEVLTTDRW